MRKNETGALAPVPGYFTSQMLQMEDLVISEEMPAFDIVEYGETASAGLLLFTLFKTRRTTRLVGGGGVREETNLGTKPSEATRPVVV